MREEWNPAFWTAWAVFLGICLFINYRYDFDRNVIESVTNPFWKFLVCLPYYGTAFGGSLGLYIFFYRKKAPLNRLDFLKHLSTWIFSLGVITAYACFDGFEFHDLVWDHSPPEVQYFNYKIAANILRPLGAMPVILILWYFFHRDQPLYGFNKSNFQLRPYLIILLMVIPIIVAGSFGKDFQKAYPRYQPAYEAIYWQIPQYVLTLIFEFVYGLNFVFVEFFFRGVMVIGLGRMMGYSALIPATTVYMFIHFGKPLGESISSVLGGLALGIFAYRTGSIYGGIFVHIGVAWTMELAAWLQSIK